MKKIELFIKVHGALIPANLQKAFYLRLGDDKGKLVTPNYVSGLGMVVCPVFNKNGTQIIDTSKAGTSWIS